MTAFAKLMYMTASEAHDWTGKGMELRGFTGWSPWSDCPAAPEAIPVVAGGVYILIRPNAQTPPSFLARSLAGRFSR